MGPNYAASFKNRLLLSIRKLARLTKMDDGDCFRLDFWIFDRENESVVHKFRVFLLGTFQTYGNKYVGF